MSQKTDATGPERKAGGEGEGGLFAGVARHSMVYALGIIMGRAVSFLMLPIYTRYLTPADYGVLALVEMTLDFIAILAGARLALGVFRYYHKAETREEQEEVVSTSFLLVAGMYALVGTLAFAFAAPLSHLIFGSGANTVIFQVAAMNVAAGALLGVPLALARVEDRSTLFVVVNLIKLALQVGLVVLFLVGLGWGVLGVFTATLIANVLVGGWATWWLFRNVRLAWTSKAAGDLLRYGLPLMATQVATFATTFSDRFFLQAVADETAVGLYNLAYQFGFVMVMLGFTPIDQIWGPKRFKVMDQANAHEVLSRALRLISVVLVSVGVAIALFVHDLLRVMATPDFHPASAIVPVILVAYILQSWASIVDIGILYRERTRYVALANFVVAGVALLGYSLLIPVYGEWGAAWVTVAAFGVQFGLIYTFSQRLHPVRYDWRPVVALSLWAVVVVSAGILLPEGTILASIGLRSLLGVVFLAGIWFLPILTGEDRAMALSWARTAVAGIRKRRGP